MLPQGETSNPQNICLQIRSHGPLPKSWWKNYNIGGKKSGKKWRSSEVV